MGITFITLLPIAQKSKSEGIWVNVLKVGNTLFGKPTYLKL